MLGFLSYLNPLSYWKSVSDFIFGPACHGGDIVCELTGGRLNLPTKLSDLILKVEELSGINKYYSGTAVLGLASVAAISYLHKKYQTKDIMELVEKMIKAELGPIAVEAFAILKKLVEEAVEIMISQHPIKLPSNMDPIKREQLKQDLMRTKFNEMLPEIGRILKEHKSEIMEAATTAKEQQASKEKAASIKLTGKVSTETTDNPLAAKLKTLLVDEHAALKRDLPKITY